MAKKKKQLSRFGLPSGRHSSTRKSVSLFIGRQKTRCTGCQKQFVLETSPKLKTEGSNHYDINVRATWGSLTSGNGLAQLNELMSTLDSPSMTQKLFSTIENEINHWWENMLEEDLKCGIEEEKRIAIENNRFHEGRSNLEKLVVETPTYKGKGKLCKRTRIRITSAVRCAIRMRSKEKDKLKGEKQLEFDIRNTLSHVYGDHTRCSEFCKAGKASKTNAGQHIDLDNDDTDDNVFTDQASMWSDGTSLEAQEESRFDYDLFPSDLDSAMRQDIALILNNVAKKSISLIGNFTTNLDRMLDAYEIQV
ncbi:Hypothetical predicted protein [Mytilus galloprovincialis]|uniref:Mutator-like transposase domain-containing protein n=1 Tax=Mytilus galloprovincialis TaxID=29158 RepID=A0A8B6E0L0_MYTGA|nr:Hypothetical predicted protein [Mytilus galloprovincialis]